MPCDADDDGWVSDSAQPAIESANAIQRANAHCDVRRVGAVLLQNEAHETLLAEDFSAQFGNAELGISPGLPLYESARNDGAASTVGVPSYPGGPLGAATLNALTKLCSADDFNDNGVTDVNEWSGSPVSLGQSRPSPALASYYAKYARFSYFAELHDGWYEPSSGTTPAAYRIVERSRSDTTGQGVAISYPSSPAGVNDPSSRQCVRHLDAQYRWTPRFSGPAQLASLNTKGGDFAEFGDVAWQGMTHHSQFKCLQVLTPAEYQSDALNDEIAPEAAFALGSQLYRSPLEGADYPLAWYPNACQVEAGSSESPGVRPKTAFADFTCAVPGALPEPGAVVWATVGFENAAQTAPYVDYTQTGDYKRGCRNECADTPALSAGLGTCDECNAGAYGLATIAVGRADAGQRCGSCGTILCNGTCTMDTPTLFGQPCGNCNGVVECGGCSKPDPPGFGQSCGGCGGVIGCNGCSKPNPVDFRQPCGKPDCNGTIECNGLCSTPDTAGKACGNCGGTYACDGVTCSRPNPIGFDEVETFTETQGFGWDAGGLSTGTSPSIDPSDPAFFESRGFADGDCPSGYERVNRPVATPDAGACKGEWDDLFNGRVCRVRVHVGAPSFTSVNCTVSIQLRRVCDN